jgi:hypothetical protein
MRTLNTALAVVFALGLGSCGIAEPDLEQVLAHHARARGGAELLESVRSLRMELLLTEPGLEADLLYRAMRPDRARVDVSIDGQVVFTEAYDGSGAWQQSPGAPPGASGAEGTAALRRGAIGNLYSLHEFPGLGIELDLLEPAEIDGLAYRPVRVTFEDGQVTHYYLDPTTFLVARKRDEHALHPDVDPTQARLETRLSDYREVDGITLAFLSTSWNLDTGERVQSVELRAVEVNPELDPAIFDMPRPPA